MKKSFIKNLDKAAEEWAKGYIAGYKEHAKNSSEKPVPKDLAIAAESFAFKSLDEVVLYGCTLSGRRACFIAGAEWQKGQHKSVPGKYTEMDFESARNAFSEDVYNHNRKNKTPIDMVDLDDAFETGADWMEKQMMKGVAEGVVANAGGEFGYDVAAFRFDDNHSYSVLLPHEEKRKYGDKVRIIIVKEDEK